MRKEKETGKGWRQINAILNAVLMGAVLTDCSPRMTTPTIEYRDRVEYVNQYVRDTIHESVTEYIYTKNDTIFQEKTKIVYKERTVRDTVFKELTDSVPYPVDVPVYVEKKLNWFQKTLIWTGGIAIILIIVFILIKLRNLSLFRLKQ